jgi:hypothetical protein
MDEKFDPAPHDKHASDPNESGKKAHAALDAGLAGSFPASDPVSVTQPATSKPIVPRADASFWEKLTGMFR